MPPGRPRFPFWFEAPTRSAGPGVRRDARRVTGRWPTVMSVHGGPEWHERGAFDPETRRVRRRRIRGGHPELPRIDRLRRRVPTRAWWATRGSRRSEDVHRVPRRADRGRDRRSGSRGLRGMVVGRLPRVSERRAPPRALEGRLRRDPVGRSGRRPLRLHAGAPGVRPRRSTAGARTSCPELWAERNPMTYVDRARAPALVIAGEQRPAMPAGGDHAVGGRAAALGGSRSRRTSTRRDITRTRPRSRCITCS